MIKLDVSSAATDSFKTFVQETKGNHIEDYFNRVRTVVKTGSIGDAKTDEYIELAKQTATATLEIMKCIGGIQNVDKKVNQSSAVVGTIADDITQVNTSVQEIADSSSQVNLKSNELSALADKLRVLVGRFKVR